MKNSANIKISELYNLDQSLSKLILPRLKKFNEFNHSTPAGLTKEKWIKIIDKMILAFELNLRIFEDLEDKDYKNMRRGLNLFAKYYNDLWH